MFLPRYFNIIIFINGHIIAYLAEISATLSQKTGWGADEGWEPGAPISTNVKLLFNLAEISATCPQNRMGADEGWAPGAPISTNVKIIVHFGRNFGYPVPQKLDGGG
jgi:hypothetical protein